MKLAWGSTRIVLLVGELALKVPTLTEWRLSLLGLVANMQERQFARTGHPKLCPMLLSIPGGWLNVMRRASPLPRDEWEAMNVLEWKETDDLTIPVEDKLDSFGKLNGQIVAVDYGN